MCVFVFTKKKMDLKPSFSNILKCLSLFDILFLVGCNLLIFNNIQGNFKEIQPTKVLKNCHRFVWEHHSSFDKWLRRKWEVSDKLFLPKQFLQKLWKLIGIWNSIFVQDILVIEISHPIHQMCEIWIYGFQKVQKPFSK